MNSRPFAGGTGPGPSPPAPICVRTLAALAATEPWSPSFAPRRVQDALADALEPNLRAPWHLFRHDYEPQGTSLVVLGVAGTLTIHTWPELACATWDAVSAGPLEPLRHALAAFAERLEWMILPPGIADPFWSREGPDFPAADPSRIHARPAHPTQILEIPSR